MIRRIPFTIFCFLFSVFCSLFSPSPNPAWAFRDSLVSLASPYQKILSKFTRMSQELSFEQFGTKYKWYATFHSKEFREAFEKQYRKFYPNGQAALAEKFFHQYEGPPQTEFFISLYAEDQTLQRMTGSKNLWDLSLVVGQEVFKPVFLEEVPLTAFQYQFYPYLERFYRGYRVVFPFNPEDSSAHRMELQLSSVAGVSTLKFNL